MLVYHEHSGSELTDDADEADYRLMGLDILSSCRGMLPSVRLDNAKIGNRSGHAVSSAKLGEGVTLCAMGFIFRAWVNTGMPRCSRAWSTKTASFRRAPRWDGVVVINGSGEDRPILPAEVSALTTYIAKQRAHTIPSMWW